jgi:chemotaxis protein MotB
MAGRRKKRAAAPGDEIPSWLLTYGDCVTLMLTFFVLLVSMAKIDESRKLVVLGSVFGSMGFLERSSEVLSRSETRRTVEPGPMDDIRDFEQLKSMPWDETGADLRFESNKVVQILSIPAEALFAPGSAEFSEQGQRILRTALPVIAAVPHPVLVAGHTSTIRDELGSSYTVEDENRDPDLSWQLSLNRALAVYRFFLENKVNPDKLFLEAFGRYRPRYPETTAEDRARNRRVDLVLDLKHPIEVARRLQRDVEESEVKKPVEAIEYQGFRFDVPGAGTAPPAGSTPPPVAQPPAAAPPPALTLPAAEPVPPAPGGRP